MYLPSPHHKLRIGLPFILGVLPSLYSWAVHAEGYCVACYSPDAVYQCVIEGSKNTASLDPRHQVLCIKLIAKEGGHSRCSVERFTNEGCKGAVRYVDADTSTLKSAKTPSKIAGTETAGSLPLTLKPAASSAKTDQDTLSEAAQDGAAVEKSSDGPFETLTKSTVQTTKNGLEVVSGVIKDTTSKTGEKILGFASTLGHATKKTWKCVSSFFSDC